MMETSFEFTCNECGQIHRGLAAWHFEAPLQALAIPQADLEARIALTEDDCVIDEREFYLKGLLELPVHGVGDPFVLGIWLSVSAESYRRFASVFDDPRRSAGDRFFGWVCNEIPGYSGTMLLKANLHVREYPMRPWVELEPTPHPLSNDQREGLTIDRAIELTQLMLHPHGPPGDHRR